MVGEEVVDAGSGEDGVGGAWFVSGVRGRGGVERRRAGFFEAGAVFERSAEGGGGGGEGCEGQAVGFGIVEELGVGLLREGDVGLG